MIRWRNDVRKSVINLDGPDGNAFQLMNHATVCKDIVMFLMSYPQQYESGDYTNLVKTFDKYFGEYVILETRNEELLEDAS